MAGNIPAKYRTVNGRDATTTDPWYVGDFRELTVSISSSATFPTSYPIDGSTADGFQASIPTNSWVTIANVTGVSTNTLLTIDPGFRWIRSRSSDGVSAASAYTLTFSGRDA